MATVGSFEAKTNLSSLLDRVARGESIVITKHGRPVARLVPVEDQADRRPAAEVVSEFAAIRSRVRPGPPVRDLLELGRKG